MIDALTATHLGILAVSLLGFFALALATERHAEHLLGKLPAPHWQMLARVTGWILLAIALYWGVADLDVGVGITFWLGWLTVAALVLVFLFPYWPWQPPVREKPVRPPKAKKEEPPVPQVRKRQVIAGALLLATAAVFAIGLARVDKQPLKRPDAIQGQVGPWRFTFAEAHREQPEIMDMDVPMKEFRLRFCEACDNDIRQAYLKVNKPRSARAVGMAFMGQRWERRAEIPLPSTTWAGSELWLTVIGKDGKVHQTALPMDRASPATVAWLDEQRKANAHR
nr:DUF3325 domain-containing protein [Comamonas koreensis]